MKRLVLSCFGLGFLPFAPGTWGSIPPVVIYLVLASMAVESHLFFIITFLEVVIASVLCVWFSPDVIKTKGSEDPSEIVVDEFAGQALVFLPACLWAGQYYCFYGIAAFGLFRFFDIVKPWPIRKMERLPKGWGILADDLLAGVFAALVMMLLVWTGIFNSFCEKFSAHIDIQNLVWSGFLGAVQGITEFLPVSSSGHLVLFETLFSLEPESSQMLLFDLSTHVGTVIAILIVFRKSLVAFFRNLIKAKRFWPDFAKMYKKSVSVRLLCLAVVTTFVTGIIGLLFEEIFLGARANLKTVALMWILCGCLLLTTDLRKKTRRSLKEFGIAAAIFIGFAQALAIFPGMSRSGATISAAILLGLHRRWAVEYSFFIALPAILGATILTVIRDFEIFGSADISYFSFLVGSITAALVGIISLSLLINLSRRAKLKYFAFYCFALAAFVFVFLSKL